MADLETIYYTKRAFQKLLDYSCSIPTGTTIGKRWKRHEPYVHDENTKLTWFEGRYVTHPDPEQVGIEWRTIRIVNERKRDGDP